MAHQCALLAGANVLFYECVHTQRAREKNFKGACLSKYFSGGDEARRVGGRGLKAKRP
jgi:hypothetical protein